MPAYWISHACKIIYSLSFILSSRLILYPYPHFGIPFYANEETRTRPLSEAIMNTEVGLYHGSYCATLSCVTSSFKSGAAIFLLELKVLWNERIMHIAFSSNNTAIAANIEMPTNHEM